MTKFTIEYRRTVRTGAYETMTIGMTEENDTDTMEQEYAMKTLQHIVDYWILEQRDEIQRQSIAHPQKKTVTH